ncbi:hypothetical protein ACH35V_22550 [Actinomadura sp. 1N219]|uniref:hypothetical protein n=1 Tax=Actinomadura sp. 1N219 TaxID=3375152 RepID=UPI00378BD049
MGRPEKPINASGGAVAAFASELRRLRALAGNPTYRDMARSALYSPSVLSSAASGHRLPTLQVTLAFVAACGGDQEVWRRRWLEVSGTPPPQPPTPPRPRDFTSRTVLAGRTVLPGRTVMPGRTVLPPPAQLPLRPRGLVGRSRERSLLSRPAAAPIVICGPVGVGKSAFALDYAHQIAGEMVDGQLYADLGSAPSDDRSLVTCFLRACGMRDEQLPAGLGQQAGVLRSMLAERKLLMLLENVRDERQVRLLMAETRRGAMIVVSRNPLLGLRDVRRVRLDVLPRDDSVTMITDALADRVTADLVDCDRLAELCGDLPLAIDIAVRKLAARPDVPLARIIGRLTDRGALLDWLRIGDVSVSDLLRSAYLQLGGAARTLLHELAHRSPGEPAGRADDLTSTAPIGDEVVDELAAAGLLRHDGRAGAYRLDPLVRAFVVRYVIPMMNQRSIFS